MFSFDALTQDYRLLNKGVGAVPWFLCARALLGQSNAQQKKKDGTKPHWETAFPTQQKMVDNMQSISRATVIEAMKEDDINVLFVDSKAWTSS